MLPVNEMAAMEYRVPGNPYYYEPNWKDGASQSSLPRHSYESVGIGRSVPSQEAEMLVNILKMLQKLDITMGLQTKRLDLLETGSPSTRSFTTRSLDATLYEDSPISRHQSVRTGASKYDFIDDEDSVEEIRTKSDDELPLPELASQVFDSKRTPAFEHTEGDLALHPPPIDPDAYSLSEYPEDGRSAMISLKRLSTGMSSLFRIAPAQPPEPVDINVYEAESSAQKAEQDITPVLENPTAHLEPEHIWINIRDTMTAPAYQNVEISFQAFDSWKRAVISGLRGESRIARKEEERRLHALAESNKRETLVQRLLIYARKAVGSHWTQVTARVSFLRAV